MTAHHDAVAICRRAAQHYDTNPRIHAEVDRAVQLTVAALQPTVAGGLSEMYVLVARQAAAIALELRHHGEAAP